MAMVDSQRMILATKIIVLLTNENTRVHIKDYSTTDIGVKK